MTLLRPRRPTRIEWLLPAALAALVVTRISPIAVPAGLVLLCYLPGANAVRLLRWKTPLSTGAARLLAVALSVALMPVVLNAVWHVTNWWPALLTCAWLASMALLVARSVCPAAHADVEAVAPDPFLETRTAQWAAVALAVFLACATIAPYWPTELFGRPMPSAIHDFIKHHAVLFSMGRHALPLGNPFFADELDAPVYYYHFFYLVPATLRALAPGLSIELAFGIQSALVAIATVGIVYLLTRKVSGSSRAAATAVVLTTVIGGLDVVPVVLERQATVTLDAWADHLVRIHNLLNQMIWSPQNMQGVLIVLCGAYLLSAAPNARAWLILGPLLLAALLGTSIWVAFPVVIALPAYVIMDSVRARFSPGRSLRRIGAAAVVAGLSILISLPSLLGYAEMSRRHGRGLTTEWPHHAEAVLGRFVPAGPLANFLDLPWILLLEFGALLVLPLMAPSAAWRRAWQDGGVRLLMTAAIAAITGFAVFRSHFDYNDFGQKSMLVALVCGAILGGMAVDGWPRWRRPARVVAVLVMLLGLPVALWEAPLTAVRRWMDPQGPLARLAPPGAATIVAEAPAYLFVRGRLPDGAVLQPHWDARRLRLLQLIDRPLGVMLLERDTRVFIGGDVSVRERAVATVASALLQVTPAATLHATLRRYRITHLFVGEIERGEWVVGAALADGRYFDPVFRSDAVQVYALK